MVSRRDSAVSGRCFASPGEPCGPTTGLILRDAACAAPQDEEIERPIPLYRPTAYRTECISDIPSAPGCGSARAPFRSRSNARSPAAASSGSISSSSWSRLSSRRCLPTCCRCRPKEMLPARAPVMQRGRARVQPMVLARGLPLVQAREPERPRRFRRPGPGRARLRANR